MRDLRKISPRLWLRFLCRRMPWIFLAALLFGGVALVRQCFLVSPVYRANCEIYIARPEIKYDPKRFPRWRKYLRLVYDELLKGTMMAQDYETMFRTAAFHRKIHERFAASHRGQPPAAFSVSAVNRKPEESKQRSRHWTISAVSGNAAEAADIANLAAEVSRDEMFALTNFRTVQVLSPAVAPRAPENSYALRYVLKCAAMGGGLAFAAFLLLFLADSRIYQISELKNLIPLPLLGVIPRNRLLEDSGSECLVANLTREMAERHRHFDAGFQILASNLRYSAAHRQGIGKIYAVTSSTPNEGKSFVSANLAAAFARMGMKTLIINCDLYKPGIRCLFGENQVNNGLVNILSGEKTFAECVQCQAAQCANLDALSGGPVPPAPARLLDSGEFRSLLEYCRCEYQIIILDSPPVTMTADALIIGMAADSVVLVARCGCTREEALTFAHRQLKDTGIAGVVFNGA